MKKHNKYEIRYMCSQCRVIFQVAIRRKALNYLYRQNTLACQHPSKTLMFIGVVITRKDCMMKWVYVEHPVYKKAKKRFSDINTMRHKRLQKA